MDLFVEKTGSETDFNRQNMLRKQMLKCEPIPKWL